MSAVAWRRSNYTTALTKKIQYSTAIQCGKSRRACQRKRVQLYGVNCCTVRLSRPLKSTGQTIFTTTKNTNIKKIAYETLEMLLIERQLYSLISR